MFSSLRLATTRSHKSRARPGSVATSASSDSTRTEEASVQQQYHPHSFLLLDEQEATSVIGTSSSPSSVSSKVAQVRVEREDGSLGVTLRGGMSKALVVTGVKADGPTAREGRIRPGDRLLAVDDTELRGLTLTEAQRTLRRSSDAAVASLTIEYDVANMEEARAASGPLLVQLERGFSGTRARLARVCVSSERFNRPFKRDIYFHYALFHSKICRGTGPNGERDVERSLHREPSPGEHGRSLRRSASGRSAAGRGRHAYPGRRDGRQVTQEQFRELSHRQTADITATAERENGKEESAAASSAKFQSDSADEGEPDGDPSAGPPRFRALSQTSRGLYELRGEPAGSWRSGGAKRRSFAGR